jgi:hypothetical protein
MCFGGTVKAAILAVAATIVAFGVFMFSTDYPPDIRTYDYRECLHAADALVPESVDFIAETAVSERRFGSRRVLIHGQVRIGQSQEQGHIRCVFMDQTLQVFYTAVGMANLDRGDAS